jgi:acetyl-CoA/propionyl-CoA carboxylase biotin carboxyl carrier protein
VEPATVKRVLIANRGEIAVRIVRACREMGLESVAVYSDADADAPHTLLADQALRIGEAPAAQSYLSIERILAAARESGADAIHPGYGFLSENARFAQACDAAGLTFIGPPPSALALMGSKVEARRVAVDAGAPVVPGEIPDGQDDTAVASAARRVGLPVLIKPAAGGGGIGMKAVQEERALPAAIAASRREAVAAFGDGTLYVERLILRPRHVEIQVIADNDGNAVHLFERECSVQRRHQKVVEETPSTAVTPRLRARMGEAAVAIALAAGYHNAGTVEFLLEGHGDDAKFYFLEMNARLQVEHPVTEAVTGADLVCAQLMVASGQSLPWRQDALTQRGHAIELRLYAEDPAAGDLPQAGTLLVYREPAMPGLRIDSGVREGSVVSVHYDPLLAKVIASGETRESARRRALEALRAFPVLGIRTNAAMLRQILEHPRFAAGDLDTGFLDTERAALLQALDRPVPPEVEALAAAARDTRSASTAHGQTTRADIDPWTAMPRGSFTATGGDT